jgi:ABC-type uncharacterized transport system permease subunit
MSARLADSRLRGLLLSLAIPIVAVLLALLVVAMLLLLVDSDPVAAFDSMSRAAFGNAFSLSTTIGKALPRLLAALGIALALRAGLWNIGAEGQIYVGAIAATAVTLWAPGLGALGIVLAILASAAAGAAWGAVPGVLRAGRGVSEVITSLMLVYVAIQLANYLLEGPWLVEGSTFPASTPVPADERLPIVWPGTLLNAGVFIGLGGMVAAWVLVARSTFGLRLRALGGSERAARFAGVQVRTTIVAAMAISGAFAGVAGSVEVLGVRGRLIEGFSPGYGFEAIAIALLGRLHPVGILGAALLFGALDAGGAGLQTAARGVPSAIVQVAEGLAVVFVLIALGVHELLARRRRARAALEQSRPAVVDEVAVAAQGR